MNKLKKLILLFLFLNATGFVYAQLKGEQLADSLKHSLLNAKEDTVKAKTLYRLARFYGSNDSATAANYAGKCLQLSQKLKWQTGIGLYYLAMAIIHNNVTDYSSEIENAKKAYDIFTQTKNIKNTGSALIVIGNSYSGSGFYTKAIEYNFKALKCFENISDTPSISTAFNNIGVCYYYLLQYDKAIEYYKKALQIYYINEDNFGIGSGLDNIAIVYLDEGKYDSANVYDLKAIPYFIKSNNMPGLGRIYGNRGDILMKLNDAKQAYEFYTRALTINKKLNIKDGISTNYGNIGEMYLDLAKDSGTKFITAPFMVMNKEALLKKSESYLKQAVEVGKDEDDIQALMNFYSLLSETEERLYNYKDALAYHKEYTLYKDSIFNDENKKKLTAMENERFAEVKDQQIKLLNQQKALETLEIKRQTLIRNIIIASVVGIALLAFLFTFLYNRRKKIQFDRQVKEVEMKALRAQMNPHFIFNSLHSISRYVRENDKTTATSYLSKFANLMRLILENSREQEVPLEKDLHALELYMQLEALRFKNKFTYTIEIDPQLDAESTLIPPMLLQPFVENAILHGIQNREDGFIKINVHKENEMICCVIEDNGNGLENVVLSEQASEKKHKSLAVKIINERLKIINQLKKAKASVNTFDLKNAENKHGGMRVELLLPLELAF